VSQHLRLLRGLRVVKSRRAGRFVYYTLDDTHVALLMRLGLAHQGHAESGTHIAHSLLGESSGVTVGDSDAEAVQ
jgi:hypothetical protein